MRLIVSVGLIVVFAASPAQAQAPQEGNLAKGKKLFIRYCAGCHGPHGQGDGYRLLGPDPANLTAPASKAKSDAELLKTIHQGKPNMPAWKLRLSNIDSRDVLAYIRTLPGGG